MTKLYNLYTRQNEFAHLRNEAQSSKRYRRQIVTDYLSIYLWYIYICISEIVVLRLIKDSSVAQMNGVTERIIMKIFRVGIDWVVLK